MEEQKKILPGDLVRLKSGGPVMTADSLNTFGWKCQWFDRNALQNGTFSTITLEHAKKEEKDQGAS